MFKLIVVLCIGFAWVGFALAEDTVPAPGLDSAQSGTEEKGEVETITITGKSPPSESEIVGSYQQPVWTAKRRFPTTRVYVLPSGDAELEYWLQTDGTLESGARAKFTSIYEIGFGLGKRFQLDLYLYTKQGGGYLPIEVSSQRIELRWALADWGVIPGNPALYLEWLRESEAPQRLEGKLLLGDQIGSSWFWGVNLAFERGLGGVCDNEYAASFGVARVVVDGIFSVGLEGKIALADVKDDRFNFIEKQLFIGPSFQLKPVPGLHMDFVPLLGTGIADTTEAIYRVYFIIGTHI